MNKSVKTSVMAVLLLLASKVYSQSDSLGMPGDNLDLRAVLSIFKQSSSVEDFEKRLNAADSKVNNLDLNNDNQVDYLRVVDYGKDDFHSIVIQDPVSKSESQDVAVIEVVKKNNETAHIQIVGDETLYGKDYIIEPTDQPIAKSSSKNTKVADDDVYSTSNSNNDNPPVIVNVWAWPSVTYIYSPGYNYWVSPWYWGSYPGWYSPWAPYGWHAYHHGFRGYNYGFYGYRTNVYAFPHAHNYYYGHRSSSGYVQKTAPHYGRRNTNMNGAGGNRVNQQRQQNRQGDRNSNQGNRAGTRKGQNNNQPSQQTNPKRFNNGNNSSPNKVERGSQRNNSPRVNPGGGGRTSPGNNGGGGRGNSGGGGGGRTNSGGGGRR